MVRLDRMVEPMRSHLANLRRPSLENHPWFSGPPLAHRLVAQNLRVFYFETAMARLDSRPLDTNDKTRKFADEPGLTYLFAYGLDRKAICMKTGAFY